MVYDYDLHYPIGIIPSVDGLPYKLDKDTYIISETIKIPKAEL
jgi:hypothetical protein